MYDVIFKQRKFNVIVISVMSATLFCAVIVLSSLSSLANTGPNANEFGSTGMWTAIGGILIIYFIPLLLYGIGVPAMKYVMAVLCGGGILTSVPIVGISALMLSSSNDTVMLYSVIIVGFSLIIVNIAWFFFAFPSEKNENSHTTQV
ncbi:DUF5391 family protein [Salipaludibacillus agaradhaerens]|jgi:hypothetical protein|nr:DUF5391 family protein [Salipaludibacillus agaradhaerens]MCR6105628.1 DUF5391 family protein [Salipaludibacillus agaradhaerens]MCR6117665.1 DUF5391 family protein [Salipaludibacillus agaradhaerens]